MGDPGQAFRDPHFWVRFTEMVFAIIAFSVIAEGAGYSRWGVAAQVCAVQLLAGLASRANELGRCGAPTETEGETDSALSCCGRAAMRCFSPANTYT